MTRSVNFRNLTREGFKFSIVSADHVGELQSEIIGRQTQGQFDKEFAEMYVPTFKFAPPDELKNAQSIIIVAMPRPPTKATFHWKGMQRTFTLPPTYTAYDEKRLHVERLVSEAVDAQGFRIATPRLPLKLLATRSGLAEYGRNNITYVQGMGSFMRLTAVYSDMPCENDQWQETRMMDRCENCDLCRKSCPTGAISPDRFLLRAERCLTYHNEKKGSIPFPDWIKPEWHNSLVGCMRCQAACPENQPHLRSVGETAEFTEEEARLILKGTPKEHLPISTLKKMKLLSLTDYYEELPRNLSVLLR
ncbi:MAG: 4Fe-4S double cluster binding domain-containing protein [Candidatus Bathyarchaeia archaeon]